MNEFSLIQRLKKILGTPRLSGLIRGIDDDTSVRKIAAKRYLLLTHDLLLQDVHFIAGSRQDFYDLGWKALAVNLSDIAAMGGRPKEALVGLGLPKNFNSGEVEALYRGLKACAHRFGCAVVGGDTNRSKHGWVLAVTVAGETDRPPLLRSGARAGETLWVTGTLGGAALGWESLRRKKSGARWKSAQTLHRRPQARVRWGEEILRSGLATAMIDLSDGLAGDARHLAEESRIGVEIDIEKIDKIRSFNNLCSSIAVNPVKLLLSGGEDYELLFTVRRGWEKSAAELFRRRSIPAQCIGRMVRSKGVQFFHHGKKLGQTFFGFEHF